VQKSVKRFLKYSLEVALLILVALAAMEAAVRAVPNAYRVKNKAMERHSCSVETLVLGNSHGYYDIMPSGLGSNCYNLAMVSQTLEYDYLLLTKYDFSHLKRVVLVVDNSNCFDMPLDKSQEWYRCTFYRLYMGCGRHGLLSKYGFELSNVPAARKKVERYADTGRVMADSLGWGEDYDTKEADNPRLSIEYSKDRAEKHRLRSYSDYAENKAWLLRLTQWCKARGVELDIVSAPVWKTYREDISPRQKTLLADAVREALGCGASAWLDYTADTQFGAADFYDCDHLSHAGADKFTKILKLALDAQSKHCKSDTSR
jgi:hypothetical protein